MDLVFVKINNQNCFINKQGGFFQYINVGSGNRMCKYQIIGTSIIMEDNNTMDIEPYDPTEFDFITAQIEPKRLNKNQDKEVNNDRKSKT